MRLLCNGYYPEILVMDAFSLKIEFTLASRVTSDWISAKHILRPPKTQGVNVRNMNIVSCSTVKIVSLNDMIDIFIYG